MQAQFTQRGLRAATLAVAMALAAVAFTACKRGEAGDAKAESAPPPTTVGTENVVVVSTRSSRAAPAISGNLQAAQEATVRAQIGGTVLQTFVDEGSRVSTGTVLARIDDRTIRDQYLSARSAMTSAQSRRRKSRSGISSATSDSRPPARLPIATSRRRARRTSRHSPSSRTRRRA